MRFAIFGVLAFVLGLGGSTGVMVLATPVRLTAADSVAVARANAARVEPVEATATPAPHAAPPVTAVSASTARETTSAVAHVATPGIVAASTGSAPGAIVQKVVPPAPIAEHPIHLPGQPDAESYKQVGNILLNMKPAEAAKIVGYLNDEQVEGLLRSMAPRQAATVLGQLPPERAAALSRRLLVPKEQRP